MVCTVMQCRVTGDSVTWQIPMVDRDLSGYGHVLHYITIYMYRCVHIFTGLTIIWLICELHSSSSQTCPVYKLIAHHFCELFEKCKYSKNVNFLFNATVVSGGVTNLLLSDWHSLLGQFCLAACSPDASDVFNAIRYCMHVH